MERITVPCWCGRTQVSIPTDRAAQGLTRSCGYWRCGPDIGRIRR